MIRASAIMLSSPTEADDDAGVSGWGMFVILIYGGCLACTSAPALRQRCQIRATHNYSVTNRHISENVERGYSVSVASEGRMVLENQHIMCWYLAQAQRNAFVSLALVRVKTYMYVNFASLQIQPQAVCFTS